MHSGIIHNADIELIDCPSEMLARWPFLQTEDILVPSDFMEIDFLDNFFLGKIYLYYVISLFQLAMYSPEDVALDPVALCQELAKQAEVSGFRTCPLSFVGNQEQIIKVLKFMKTVQCKKFYWETNVRFTVSTQIMVLWKLLDL